MAGLEFLADMDISPQTVRDLRKLGWRVDRVSDLMDASTSDAAILALARDHHRVVITRDLDFSALLALGGHTRPSVISLRLEEPTPSLATRRVTEVVAELSEELRQGIVVSVDEVAARYRRLPIRPDVE